MRSLLGSMLAPHSFLAAFLVLGATALAQDAPKNDRPSRPGPAGNARPPAAPYDGPSRIVPAGPATWDAIEKRGPTVDYELGSEGGWYYWPPVLQWRFLDPSQWATTDPIVEVHVYPPYSGSTTNVEAFLLQIPTTNPAPPQDRGLVIGFHGFSLSPAQIFGVAAGKTELAQFCTANGWLLLGPNGLHTGNMGSVPTQKALEVDLALLYGLFQFNVDKVYHFGFSMGGLNAMSFAFRHQDPYALRPAGIIHHTGTTDIVRDYNEASAFAQQQIWQHPLVFGASPAADPFAYDRVNPARFHGVGPEFQDEYFQLEALKHTPFYLHWNTADPTKYDNWNDLLEDEMVARGFNLKSVQTSGPATHTIVSIDVLDAIEWVSQWDASALPATAVIYADRPARYLWSEVLTDPAPHVARYTVTIDAPSNGFTVEDTHWVDQLAFDLGLMDLDPSQTITCFSESGDGTPDTIVLKGYAQSPTTVTADGLPPTSWSYDSIQGAVSVTPNPTGAVATVEIVP